MHNQQEDASTYGKLYYDTGELKYEGFYITTNFNTVHYEPSGKGIHYYKNGTIYREGIFQHGGLIEGKEFYPSGKLKFEGYYNCRNNDIGYYGPSYPMQGKFFNEDGTLVYEGEFIIVMQGSIGYPKVVYPEGFGTLK